jgi:hypothetical protein
MIVMAICKKERAYWKYLIMHVKRESKLVIEEGSCFVGFGELLGSVYKFLLQLVNLKLSGQKSSSLYTIVGVI